MLSDHIEKCKQVHVTAA